MSRAKKPEEVRREFLDQLRVYVEYWSSLPDKTTRERLDGLAFSVLSMIDGCTLALPAIELVLRTHPNDKAFHKSEGENWHVNGQCINSGAVLHEEWHNA